MDVELLTLDTEMAPGLLPKLTADEWQKLKEKLPGVTGEIDPCLAAMLMTMAMSSGEAPPS